MILLVAMFQFDDGLSCEMYSKSFGILQATVVPLGHEQVAMAGDPEPSWQGHRNPASVKITRDSLNPTVIS